MSSQVESGINRHPENLSTAWAHFSRLQEREVWKNMENGWCCWWTKNIQSPVCFRQLLTKHVLKLSQDCVVGNSLALRSTVHYHCSKQRQVLYISIISTQHHHSYQKHNHIRMQGFLYINSIQLATLSSKKSSNNLIPPARSRLQGQEKSAKILVQIWASSNLSVTSHHLENATTTRCAMVKSGYIMGIIALLLEIHRLGWWPSPHQGRTSAAIDAR